MGRGAGVSGGAGSGKWGHAKDSILAFDVLIISDFILSNLSVSVLLIELSPGH